MENLSVFIGTAYPPTLRSSPLDGTQGSTTQGPRVVVSDSFLEYGSMKGCPILNVNNATLNVLVMAPQPTTSKGVGISLEILARIYPMLVNPLSEV